MKIENILKNKKQESGLLAKENGKSFEKLLDSYFQLFAILGYCNIEKTPEPFRFIKPYQKNLFIGCFVKSAQPDYKGTNKGGRAIVLEAKSVSDGKINKSALTENEFTQLQKHKRLGALSGVIVYDQTDGHIYLFPFTLFESMEELRGRKSLVLKKEKNFDVTKDFLEKDVSTIFEKILN